MLVRSVHIAAERYSILSPVELIARGGAPNQGYKGVIGPTLNAIRWTYDSSSVVYSPAIDANGNVYFANENSQLTSLDPAKNVRFIYSSLFSQGDPPLPESPPLILDNGRSAYVAHRGPGSPALEESGALIALDAQGSFDWSFNPQSFGSWMMSPPNLSLSGEILVSDFGNIPSGNIHFLNPATGTTNRTLNPYSSGFQYDAEGIAIDESRFPSVCGRWKPSAGVCLY